MTSKVLLTIIILLLILIGYQTYRLEKVQRDYAKEQLKKYEQKIAESDSLVLKEMKKLVENKTETVKYYYTVKEKAKKDKEKYEEMDIDDLLDTLSIWINKRARASELIQRNNN